MQPAVNFPIWNYKALAPYIRGRIYGVEWNGMDVEWSGIDMEWNVGIATMGHDSS